MPIASARADSERVRIATGPSDSEPTPIASARADSEQEPIPTGPSDSDQTPIASSRADAEQVPIATGPSDSDHMPIASAHADSEQVPLATDPAGPEQVSAAAAPPKVLPAPQQLDQDEIATKLRENPFARTEQYAASGYEKPPTMSQANAREFIDADGFTHIIVPRWKSEPSADTGTVKQIIAGTDPSGTREPRVRRADRGTPARIDRGKSKWPSRRP